MLFIEIEGSNSPKFRLEFHPRVTVVSKLSWEMRQRLAVSLRACLFGDPVDLVMSVDVGGVPQELTADLLARVGLQRRPLDNVITAADLPGAVVLRKSSTTPDAVSAPALHSVAFAYAGDSWASLGADEGELLSRDMVGDGPLFEARKELAEAEARAEELARRIERARFADMDTSADDLEVAEAAVFAARARVDELTEAIRMLEQQVGPQRESKVVRMIRLRQAEASVNERIHQLRETLAAPDGDRSEVQQCLDASANVESPQAMQDRSKRLDLLVERYEEDAALVARIEHQPRPPVWLVEQTKDQIDEAQARITAFTYQIKEGIDVRKSLQRAQDQLREAQEAWDEIENGVEGELRAARGHLEESVANLETFLGIEPGVDVKEAITAEREVFQNAQDPRVDLVVALEAHNVHATVETAVEIAERWLTRQRDLEAMHSEVQRNIAAALLDLGDVRKQITDVSVEPESIETNHEETRQLNELRAQYDAAVRLLQDAQVVAKELADRSTQPTIPQDVARLDADYEDALAIVDAAGRKVDYFARLDALRHDRVEPVAPVQAQEPAAPFAAMVDAYAPIVDAVDSYRPWWEGRDDARPVEDSAPLDAEVEVDTSQISEADVEVYVLSRAASLRMAARGESVPLIVDGAFDTLDPHLAARLLAALAKVSSMVQIVYLSSGHVAEDWVKRQNEMIAAKVTVEY